MEVEKRWGVEALSAMVDDLRRVAKRCKRKTFTQLDYANQGSRYSASTICRAFGGWRKAKIAAGLIEAPDNDKDAALTPEGRQLLQALGLEEGITLTCLCCDRPFLSWNRKVNRLCNRCKTKDDWKANQGGDI